MTPQMLRIRLVTAACLLALGCGGGADGRKTVYPVTGKITMSGGPLIGASVSFAPREGQPVAVGRTNDQGEYTLTTYEASDGAAAGPFAVVVTKATATGAAAEVAHSSDPYASGGGESHSAKEKSAGAGGGVPQQYTSSQTTPLTATVTADGENRFDFEL